MENDYLHPVSYHLRHFGQYTQLDLVAATDGNLTLLGANAVGKTTLANAFYPVLIDGSIATPNFNPARSSDAVSGSTDPRNTTRDKRTFNSMLLGWGPAQYQVRTGYTYMVFASAQRQVVLGIGAHRQTDGKKAATWWFVLVSREVAALTCVDDAGAALDKQGFIDANAGFGEELQVYDTWQAYRGAVARDVYGFDGGEALGKLANAYRLLASPILTGGSARFAPIPNALRMAQEPIDRVGIIEPLATSQRSLNQTLAQQHELQLGLARLDRIKQAQFWGNLNRLNATDDGLLPRHVTLAAQRDQAQAIVTNALATISQLAAQQDGYQTLREQADEVLAGLQERLADQASLERQRDYLDTQIANWRSELDLYQRQMAEKSADEAVVAKHQEAVVALQQAAATLRADQLEPVIAQLYGLSANRTELTQALAQTDDAQLLASLADFVITKQRQLKDYHHLAATIAQTSADVALVVGMQGDMGTAIDTRLTGRRNASVNAALQTDNRQIHEAGAATMNAQVAALQAKQQALLAAAPDLRAIIAAPDLLGTLQDLQAAFAAAMQALDANRHDEDLAQVKLTAAQGQLDKLLAAIDPDFDPAVAETQINVLTAERNDLQRDPTLTDQVAKQKQTIKGLDASINKLIRQRGEAEGTVKSQRIQIEQTTQELTVIDDRLESDLRQLRLFAPADAALDDILATLQFAHSNGAQIREHPFSQLGSELRSTLDGREHEQPLDVLFDQREAHDLAAQLRGARTVEVGDLLVVPIDLAQAIALFTAGLDDLARAVAERQSGQLLAMQTYINAAALHIAQQYQLIPEYNQMLTEGIDPRGIRLEVALEPLPGSTEAAVAEARNLQLTERPALTALVQNRIDRLVNNPDLATDAEAFMDEAEALLDTRLWSEFKIYIYRRHSDERELVNDAFVQSGGSGAEKAQAMVLPLLLVPKMRLHQAAKPDAPHLVMFDEFADKLDPETARAFAQTIDRFGFNFIATMPSGAQTKILADGVANRAYEVLAPDRTDGKFHANQVHEVMQWHATDAGQTAEHAVDAGKAAEVGASADE
ncbi:SbcC/MukB-like Walker B domain-containing protein [Lacticaseibacillus absianus]|uniref:SbcC/MukB-like Walker B domain-containing protein n=1 Tax=Lacticaseibacillus absianus TaxID=2729623 RepID=UPI001FE3EEEF|nr:SbcC/MukB-like Walker B domain-containing protein [Lacticaseibacillus absianus]